MSSTQHRQNYTTRRKEIGVRVRTLRKELGLTQIEFAQHLQCSPGTVSTLETGEARREQTLVEHVTYIAKTLGKSTHWLLTGEGAPVDPSSEPALSPNLNDDSNSRLQRGGRNIQTLRKAMGLTPGQFAHLVEIDQGTLSAIEHGTSKTQFDLHVHNCCQVLGVSYDALFELDADAIDETPAEAPSNQLDRIEQKLDRILKHFNIQ